MPTNKERREVAARLRELDDHIWYDGMDEVDSLETAIGCAIGQDWQDQNWWERLADLIEPEPEHTCKIVSSEMFDERGIWVIELSCGHADVCCVSIPNHCSYCGAKVIK